MQFLITRPEHDPTMFYLAEWSKELIKMAREKGIPVFDLNKERANPAEVENFLRKKNPRLVMFNGHGSEETVMGHKNEILIESGKNEELLKDKIVYCRSCNSAAKLGKDCTDCGTTAFIGYKDLFGFPFDPQKTANPITDELAKPCLAASNQIIKSLLKGNTVTKAYNSSQNAFDSWAEKMQRTNAPPEAPQILLWLFWNKVNQHFHGDGNAKLNT